MAHECFVTSCQAKSRGSFCSYHWKLIGPELKEEWKRRVYEYKQEKPGAEKRLVKLIAFCARELEEEASL